MTYSITPLYIPYTYILIITSYMYTSYTATLSRITVLNPKKFCTNYTPAVSRNM